MMESAPREHEIGVTRPQTDLSSGLPHSIEVDIEELALHGFEPQGCFAIAEAIRRELTELLNDGGFPSAWVGTEDMARLDGGMFEVAPGSPPETIGRQVARAVYERWLASGRPCFGPLYEQRRHFRDRLVRSVEELP